MATSIRPFVRSLSMHFSSARLPRTKVGRGDIVTRRRAWEWARRRETRLFSYAYSYRLLSYTCTHAVEAWYVSTSFLIRLESSQTNKLETCTVVRTSHRTHSVMRDRLLFSILFLLSPFAYATYYCRPVRLAFYLSLPPLTFSYSLLTPLDFSNVSKGKRFVWPIHTYTLRLDSSVWTACVCLRVTLGRIQEYIFLQQRLATYNSSNLLFSLFSYSTFIPLASFHRIINSYIRIRYTCRTLDKVEMLGEDLILVRK